MKNEIQLFHFHPSEYIIISLYKVFDFKELMVKEVEKEL